MLSTGLLAGVFLGYRMGARLAVLTNRWNQNVPPVERISFTTAFAPLNNGSTVVIMKQEKSRGLGREVLMRLVRESNPG